MFLRRLATCFSETMRISVIIPVLNEESCLEDTLNAIRALAPEEILVADGGSTDRSVEIASAFAKVIHSPRGRGIQQATAASQAYGEVLWFLHADTVPAPGALGAIFACLQDPSTAGGNFSLCFDGGGRSARQLTQIYPWLRLLGLCYGDSGIFVRRSVYLQTAGFQPYPLFEDVDMVRQIRRSGKFRTLPERLTTSSRRFENRNFALMFAEWTALQALFWAGVSPHRIARMYKPVRRVRRSGNE